jgi:hypothetical protein
MSKSKKKPGSELSIRQEPSSLTMEQVLAHPVVQQMNRQLEDLKSLVQALPEAIGRAVAAGSHQNLTQREDAVPMLDLSQDSEVVIGKEGVTIDGKEYPAAPMKLGPRPNWQRTSKKK